AGRAGGRGPPPPLRRGRRGTFDPQGDRQAPRPFARGGPPGQEARAGRPGPEGRKRKADPSELIGHLAALRTRQGRYGDAEAVYRQVLGREPRNTAALNNRSCLLALRGRADEALTLVGRALAVEGPVPFLLDTRALAYLGKKRSDRAVKDLEEAVTEA